MAADNWQAPPQPWNEHLPLAAGCVARCPGCAYRHLTDKTSAARKTAGLNDRLAPWAHCLDTLRETADSDRWGYRDKVCLTTEWRNGEWRFGLRRRDEVVAIPKCPVHTPRVRGVIEALGDSLPPQNTFPMAFFVQSGAQTTLVLKTAHDPDSGWIRPPLLQTLTSLGVEALWLNLHPSAGKRLFAKNGWRLLWGTGLSRDALGLIHGPSSFQQLRPSLYKQALDQAERFLALTADSHVVDLYCGTGASLSRWLRRGARCMGVELSGESIECTRLNAPGALVLRGQCAQRLPQVTDWLEAGGATPDRTAVCVNPPRTGLETDTLNWIGRECRPAKLTYLSCSAATLARDLKRLTALGFEVDGITPFDFFPQTRHVEVLARLCRARGKVAAPRSRVCGPIAGIPARFG